MDRRVFISSVACGAVVVALAATAQTQPSPNRPRRVVWLQGGAADTPDVQKEVDDALAEVGWIVGKDVLVDRRYVRPDELSRTAEDSVNAKVDLIITSGTDATVAAKNATTSIPILMWSAADPVGSGLVGSLARPGGNVTGMALLSPEQSVKRLSLIRELLPGIRRVGQLIDSANPGLRAGLKQLEEAYRSVGMEPIFVDTARIAKFDDLLVDIVQRRAQALNIWSDAVPINWYPQLFGAAVAMSLPTIVDDYRMLEAGALLFYGNDPREFSHRGAVLFDKLLRGTKPADLPVEQPTKFILGINLRIAKALRITIPQTLLLRADRLIQ